MRPYVHPAGLPTTQPGKINRDLLTGTSLTYPPLQRAEQNKIHFTGAKSALLFTAGTNFNRF